MTDPAPDLFADDDARAVRTLFRAEIDSGRSVIDASQAVLDRFAAALEDPARSVTIYLALAALQADLGSVQGAIRKQALAAIFSGRALAPWLGLGDAARAARERVLDDLRWRLH